MGDGYRHWIDLVSNASAEFYRVEIYENHGCIRTMEGEYRNHCSYGWNRTTVVGFAYLCLAARPRNSFQEPRWVFTSLQLKFDGTMVSRLSVNYF